MTREEEIRARAEAELKNLQRSPLVMISGSRVEKVLGEDIPYLPAENAQLQRELEAAKRDLTELSDEYKFCKTCKFDNGGGIDDCHKFDCDMVNRYEWRGPQEGANE